MFSGKQIADMSNETARQAARKGKRPYVFFDAADVTLDTLRSLPNLGNIDHPNWERYTDGDGNDVCWEVDSGDSFVATPEHLLGYIKEVLREKDIDDRIGFAITSEGQFSVIISAFLEIERKTEDHEPEYVGDAWMCDTCYDIMPDALWSSCWADNDEDQPNCGAEHDDNGDHAYCHGTMCDGDMELTEAYQCMTCDVLHEELEGAERCCS